jgi:transposase
MFSYALAHDPFVSRLRSEARKLRQDADRYQRAWKKQKEKSDELSGKLSERENENKRLKKEHAEDKKRLEKEIENLNNQLNLLKSQNQKLAENVNTYTKMIFARKDRPGQKSDKKRGAQIGHIGTGRKYPERIDEIKHVSLLVCPDCGLPVSHGKHFKNHFVEDAAELKKIKTIVTCWEIEEQYCTHCKRHVRAVPDGVIPGSRLGLNIVLLLAVLRTVSNQSLYQICTDMNIIFGTKISAGGAEQILHRAREYLGSNYDEILKLIQQAKVKHADETSWSQISGDKQWDWTFTTATEVYHTIRNTRGKGIPQEIIGGANCRKDSVLVRDGYAGYNSLDCHHQICWAHLLRVSRERLEMYSDSKEMKTLHEILSSLFGLLSKTIKEPFEVNKRKEIHTQAWQILENIINASYSCPGAKKVQTRIKNENTDLLTALLYEGVPLTNNLAERRIRPMVIHRKVTGGSRSSDGAKTTAVLQSITQTIQARQQPLVETLKDELLKGILTRRTQIA